MQVSLSCKVQSINSRRSYKCYPIISKNGSTARLLDQIRGALNIKELTLFSKWSTMSVSLHVCTYMCEYVYISVCLCVFKKKVKQILSKKFWMLLGATSFGPGCLHLAENHCSRAREWILAPGQVSWRTERTQFTLFRKFWLFFPVI